MLTPTEGQELLVLARRALEAHFTGTPETWGVNLRTPEGIGGVFATLKLDGELRGCIGYVVPDVDLPRSTVRAVVAAATGDPRFQTVRSEELTRITITISVLTELVAVEDVDEIEVGRDGLVVEREGARGLLLPQVAAERGWDRDRFLAETCVKAGLRPDSWKDPQTVILRFQTDQFDEA